MITTNFELSRILPVPIRQYFKWNKSFHDQNAVETPPCNHINTTVKLKLS